MNEGTTEAAPTLESLNKAMLGGFSLNQTTHGGHQLAAYQASSRADVIMISALCKTLGHDVTFLNELGGLTGKITVVSTTIPIADAAKFAGEFHSELIPVVTAGIEAKKAKEKELAELREEQAAEARRRMTPKFVKVSPAEALNYTGVTYPVDNRRNDN